MCAQNLYTSEKCHKILVSDSTCQRSGGLEIMDKLVDLHPWSSETNIFAQKIIGREGWVVSINYLVVTCTS